MQITRSIEEHRLQHVDTADPIDQRQIKAHIDIQMAIATREAYLDFIAGEKMPVAGMHIPMPGMGTLKRDHGTPNGYIFTPAKF